MRSAFILKELVLLFAGSGSDVRHWLSSERIVGVCRFFEMLPAVLRRFTQTVDLIFFCLFPFAFHNQSTKC